MNISVKKIFSKSWPGVADYLSVPHDQESYRRMSDLLDSLVDEIGEDQNHPLTALMETVGILLAEYEKDKYNVPEAGVVEILQYLMAETNTRQSDLAEIGSQGVVSEILNGKRELNVRQIRALAKKFNVAPAVFLKG